MIGDLCTGHEEQEFKYGCKEIDRTFGLDLFDFHARQQDAKLACFNAIDPLAEKYYSISPYAYCAGDPVNLVDRDGRQPGDYYDENGFYMGSDNIADDKKLLLSGKSLKE